ncbi:DUF2203 domain-containing protein [Planctomycetes bacterium K23_9]|uniref:DUF2203 domain-containing protein n=1 Tax=Stieleria marina TaxID=1930275 RepID=A0A517NWY0_9BACT|nr:hypothetical protein K239x_36190 [Planctomycetes bacterium K23_9]
MVHAIDNGNDASIEPVKLFTPSAATRMLPLIRRIVVDITRLNESIEAQRDQLAGVDSIDSISDDVHYRDELTDMRASLADDELTLARCVAELTSLGVSIHHPIDGSVDFPAIMNRRPVHLCWSPGEESVSHWHEMQSESKSEPRARQKIDPTKFGVESLN